MSGTILSLAGVPFRDFEIPETILFGGAQSLAVHQLIGGGRVVDALGAADAEIVFSGAFSGTDAVLRAQALDAARALGVPLPLVWGDFYYSVIIASFVAEFAKAWWIPFELRCVVVTDPAELLAAAVAPAAQLVANDVASAGALAEQAGLGLVGLASASAVQFADARTSVANGVASVGGSMSASVASFGAAPDAATGIAALTAAGASAGQLAALVVVGGYVGRAAQIAATAQA